MKREKKTTTKLSAICLAVSSLCPYVTAMNKSSLSLAVNNIALSYTALKQKPFSSSAL